MKHSLEDRKEARELFELNLTYEQIAEQMGIPRWMTIYDWARQDRLRGDPWKRKNSIEEEGLILYRKLRLEAKKFLKDATFGSVSEALKIYKETSIAIKAAERLKQGPQVSKPSVLGVLDISLEDESRTEEAVED